MITVEVERNLVSKAQNGDQKATRALIDAHMNMIRAIARRKRGMMEEDDAISEGVIGFLRGLKKFELERGFRLNTYVRHYVAEAIGNAMQREPLIRIPRSSDSLFNMQMARDVMKREGTVSPEIIAKQTGISRKKAIDAVGKMAHMRKSNYAEINEAFQVADDRENVVDAIIRQQQKKIIRDATLVLNERERHIFNSRQNTADDPLTLEELGAIHGVTRERIRQIEMKAIEKVEKAIKRMAQERQLA